MGAMLGGVIEACALQPLDVLKTRMQLSGTGSLAVVAGSMLRQEGPLAFYKGLTPFCLHLVTKYSVRWYFNEFYRSLLSDKNGKVSIAGGFVAGLGSGLTEAVLIVTPFEVLKTRLQKQKGTDKSQLKYKSLSHCATTIAREEGVMALWKGNIPTMLRQGINQLLLFGTYDGLKKMLYGLEREAPISPTQVPAVADVCQTLIYAPRAQSRPRLSTITCNSLMHPPTDHTDLQSLTIGIIAGALGPLANNPIDVVKTRYGTQSAPSHIVITAG